MIPSVFVLLEQLPLTPNGKIDRKALPEPDMSAQQAEYIAPRSETEKVLCEIWQEVLGVERVGIVDNFFQLGGHSLLAARLISRINQRLNISLPLKTLFLLPSLGCLAQELLNLAPDHGYPKLEKVSKQGPLMLSYSQQRMWLLNQIDNESTQYHMPSALKLSGPLDVKVLNQAFSTIFERHESLRTVFVVNDAGEPHQVVTSVTDFTVNMEDLSMLEPEARELRIVELKSREACAAFDLSGDLMLRPQLVKLAEDEHILLVTMHHIASDGWSIGILIDEFCTLYRAYSQNQVSPLPIQEVQYADYAHWQHNYIEHFKEQALTFWCDELSGAPDEISLPTDYAPEPGGSRNEVGRQVINVRPELLTRFKHLLLTHQSTLFSGLFSSLNLLLHRWCELDDLVIGVVDAGRDHAEIESLIGCFINTLAIRGDLSADESLNDYLCRSCSHLNSVMEHKSLPFNLVVDAVNPARKIDANPLFNVALLLQNYTTSEIQIDNLLVSSQDTSSNEALLDLRFIAEESEDGLTLTCEYRAQLFTESTIRLLLEAYQSVIEQLLDQPQRLAKETVLPARLIEQAKQSRLRHKTLCVAGTFTLEPLLDSFQFWCDSLNLEMGIQLTPFQQVFQQLLDANSELRQNKNGFNLILLSLHDWLGTGDVTEQQANLTDSVGRFCRTIEAIQAQSPLNFVIILCPSSAQVCAEPLLQSIELQQNRLQAQLESLVKVELVLPDTLEQAFQLGDCFDIHSFNSGHVPYTPSYYSALMSTAFRKLSALERKPYKVIVLDCDNTLWQGLCAEEGATGVAVTDEFKYLQRFALDLKTKGFVLCLCSANEAEDAWAVFDQHSEMLLRREHIVGARINWEPKWKNIQSLANELNLGLDSFIFIDDDSLQCAQMKQFCPQVLTLQLPVQMESLPLFFNSVWAFDIKNTSGEQQDRTIQYKQNQQREQLQQATGNRQEFLDSLKLDIDVQTLSEMDYARAQELLQRTNQFNLTGMLVDELTIKAKIKTGELCAVSARLSDKFGSYGLVGLSLFRIKHDTLFIDNAVLSCRAFGRGVEYELLTEVARIAQLHGVENISIPFIRTARNTPALAFLEQLLGKGKVNKKPESQYFFKVEALLGLNYRKVLEKEDIASSATVSKMESQRVISSVSLLSSQHYSQIAELSQNFSLLAKSIELNAQQKRKAVCSGLQSEYVAPRSETEKVLCEIWQEVLGVERVGVTDNFFQLGGDSILLVQVMSNAVKLGLQLTVKQLFERQDIESLAGIVRTEPYVGKGNAVSEVVGKMPVSPILHWLFKRGEDFEQYNAFHWLNVDSRVITLPVLEKAYLALVTQHDILRSQLSLVEGEWVEEIVSTDIFIKANPVLFHDLTHGIVDTELIKLGRAKLCSMKLSNSPIQMHYFQVIGNEAKVLLSYHHRVFDGYSHPILHEDLIHFLKMAISGVEINYPIKSASVKEFAKEMKCFANNKAEQDKDYWLSLPWHKYQSMPKDRPNGKNTVNSSIMLEHSLAEEASACLLNNLSRSTGLSDTAIHLACIAMAYREWSGHSLFVIDIAITVRSLPFIDLDLSRTLGWLLDPVPVVIDLDLLPKDIISAAKSLNKQLKELPNKGVSYGCLRYLSDNDAIKEQMHKLPHAEFLFNYQASWSKTEEGNPVMDADISQYIKVETDKLAFEENRSSALNVYESPDLDRGVAIYAEGIRTANGAYKARFQISGNLHDRETVQPFLNAYVDHLQELVTEVMALA
ncbi:HAD-IIIC family phosphatase [Motilimonas pumila]|nr:HAD-IIIC family phosphatase [Motilimonas pumila]